MNENDSRTARRLKAIEGELTAKPLTAVQLAAAIHVVHVSALEYIRHLMSPANKRIRIARWRRLPGHIVAVYRWGSGPDAPKPAAMTAVESARAARKRLCSTEEGRELLRAKERARYQRKKALARPQSWFAALEVRP